MADESKKANPKENLTGCLVFIIIASILVYACSGDDEPPEQKAARQSEKTCKDEISARVMAEQFVKARLKAPSTAKFSGYGETKTKYLGDCKHVVVGYVDSQNSFGAQIRTQYGVTVKNEKGTDNWVLEEFTAE